MEPIIIDAGLGKLTNPQTALCHHLTHSVACDFLLPDHQTSLKVNILTFRLLIIRKLCGCKSGETTWCKWIQPNKPSYPGFSLARMQNSRLFDQVPMLILMISSTLVKLGFLKPFSLVSMIRANEI